MKTKRKNTVPQAGTEKKKRKEKGKSESDPNPVTGRRPAREPQSRVQASSPVQGEIFI